MGFKKKINYSEKCVCYPCSLEHKTDHGKRLEGLWRRLHTIALETEKSEPSQDIMQFGDGGGGRRAKG